MLAKRALMVGAIILLLTGMTACGQGTTQEVGAAVAPVATATAGAKPATGEVVDVTPLTDAELAAQPVGQTDPGGSTEDAAATTEPPPTSMEPGMDATYTDSTYGFSVGHPADFVIIAQPAEQLAALAPRPVAVIRFLNPVTAASDIVELEPADLEVRIFAADPAATLEQWLIANTLLPADGTGSKPFQTARLSGIEVCASTMLAPGCSYYVEGDTWIYQMTPATTTGESMLQTVTIAP
jgi:hypothetical protein